MWANTGVLQSLAKKCRVIALDCRGHGRSDKPHDAASYGTEMSEDIVRLLDELDIKKAHLVGYSMGAEIALKLTTQHPDRVKSLVLGGSGWSGKSGDAVYQQLAESLEKSASLGHFLRATTPTGIPEPTDATIASFDELLEGNDIEALVAVAKSMGSILDLSPQEVSDIRIPVLGISGENDPERGKLESMVGVVRDFSMKVLPGRNHMDAPSDPQFVGIITEFLSGQQ
jgi:pimeloyl-ACP methyl ester carboxylesterase